MQTITCTSWNGTPLIYNNTKDTWELSDNVTIGKDHEASAKDLAAAQEAATREGINADIQLIAKATA
jgi:hypothetical protein